MARRKNKPVEHVNHERWMVSYADFITLLFAFFVVMYSISSINEGKYRVLSESLVSAFHSTARSVDPIQIGKIKRVSDAENKDLMKKPNVVEIQGFPKPIRPPEPDRKKMPKPDPQMVELYNSLRAALAALVDKGLVFMQSDEDGIRVELNSRLLFTSGSASVTPHAIPILKNLAKILRPYPNDVKVEGYTDNRPINSTLFPSNWELSAARAASVVHLFTQDGVQPTRLVAMGFGQFSPVASNDTEAGRIRNRRVVLYIPVTRDKEKIKQALTRLGDKAIKGQTKTDPAGTEPADGFRTRKIRTQKASRIGQPNSETKTDRFGRIILTPQGNGTTSTAKRRFQQDGAKKPTTSATATGGDEKGPHIDRAPIKAAVPGQNLQGQGNNRTVNPGAGVNAPEQRP